MLNFLFLAFVATPASVYGGILLLISALLFHAAYKRLQVSGARTSIMLWAAHLIIYYLFVAFLRGTGVTVIDPFWAVLVTSWSSVVRLHVLSSILFNIYAIRNDVEAFENGA